RDSHIPTAGHDCLFSKSNPKKEPLSRSLPSCLPGSFFNEKMLAGTVVDSKNFVGDGGWQRAL
ncbi:MAG: hypothetical protein JWO80_3108, partial [Bryobacterales bacterium]|nr:hypothetical protein [Bryobacterales bacterium]